MTAINRYASGIKATVVETGGALDNLQRLSKKQIELGVGNSATTYEYYSGKGEFEGKPPHPEIRVLHAMYKFPLVVVVREDSGIKSIYDLNGKKFCAGARGTGTEKLLINCLALLGVKPDYYHGGYDDATTAVENKQITGFAKSGASETTGDALIVSLATIVKLRFLSFSKEDLEKIRKEFPYIVTSTISPNVHKGQNYEVLTIGLGGVTPTATHVSPDVGYRICQAVWKGRDIVGAAYPSMKGQNPYKEAVELSTVPLHAGTVKFCKELNIEVPQNLIPPEYYK